jgi:hypothetical protein
VALADPARRSARLHRLHAQLERACRRADRSFRTPSGASRSGIATRPRAERDSTWAATDVACASARERARI